MSECSAYVSCKSFIVSGLTFRSLIHFQFIFVYGVRGCFNFIPLHVAGPVFPAPLIGEAIFSPLSMDQQTYEKMLKITNYQKMHMKTVMRCHLTLVRMATIKNLDSFVIGWVTIGA